jgi:hypothetical protein
MHQKILDPHSVNTDPQPGLWIRIHFFRIRIRIGLQPQTLDPDPDPDPDPIRIQGFNDQKLKKNYS